MASGKHSAPKKGSGSQKAAASKAPKGGKAAQASKAGKNSLRGVLLVVLALAVVVCAFAVTMLSFSPTIAFISVDLPTFGLPIMFTNPDLNISSHFEDVHLALGELSPRSLLETLLRESCEVNSIQGLDLVAQSLE